MMNQNIIEAMKSAGYRFSGTEGGRLCFRRTGAAQGGSRRFKAWEEVREFADKSSERHTLQELAAIDIDLWVEAMSNLADRHGDEIEGYKDDQDECPAEYEGEFTEFAEERCILFNGFGEIAEYGKPPKRTDRQILDDIVAALTEHEHNRDDEWTFVDEHGLAAWLWTAEADEEHGLILAAITASYNRLKGLVREAAGDDAANRL
jgi:hypothetical protein